MKKIIYRLLLSGVFFAQPLIASAQDYVPSPENLEARSWFDNAGFGMFIHWGVYSILGDGEWVMIYLYIPFDAYEKLPS
ncbi:MAG: alpha-L-fucosidase, partial [Flavobacteriaceae bacterium]